MGVMPIEVEAAVALAVIVDATLAACFKCFRKQCSDQHEVNEVLAMRDKAGTGPCEDLRKRPAT